MRYINFAIFAIAVLFLTNLSVAAQETEMKVVDEVIAQVNDGVVTLSRVKREMKDIVDTSVLQGKPREQAQAEVEGKQAELIASMINEELILQKGKDLQVDSEVQGQINQRLAEIMKQQNIKSLDALYKEMEKNGVDPQEIRDVWRKEFTKDLVLQREVDQKVYFGWTQKEIKSYYDANKAKFTKPETVSISEIFLSFAGRDEAAVREKAKQLVAQARKGIRFEKLAVENSDRPDVAENKGKVGEAIKLKEMDPRFAKPLETIKAGGVTDPIEVTEGMEILRVDERTKSSSESFFDEAEVRKAMTYEILPNKRKEFLSTLRSEAYIKINDKYRPAVSPILFIEERKAEVKKSEK